MQSCKVILLSFILFISSLFAATPVGIQTSEQNATLDSHKPKFYKPLTHENNVTLDNEISAREDTPFSLFSKHATDKHYDKYWDDGSSFFLKIYGNYGGIGNRGGEPRDDLDRVFQKHDYRYGEYGFLDAKSDARLLRELVDALFHKHIHREGYMVGPPIFLFFATSLPSLYRTEPFGKGFTLPIPVPNTSCALCAYQSEKAYEFLKDKKKVNREFQRIKEQTEEAHEDSNDWLKNQKEDAEDFFKKVF
jgi:hypothetical protein